MKRHLDQPPSTPYNWQAEPEEVLIAPLDYDYRADPDFCEFAFEASRQAILAAHSTTGPFPRRLTQDEVDAIDAVRLSHGWNGTYLEYWQSKLKP